MNELTKKDHKNFKKLNKKILKIDIKDGNNLTRTENRKIKKVNKTIQIIENDINRKFNVNEKRNWLKKQKK